MSERDFQNRVIELAKMLGWKVAAFRPAMNRRGQWSTPMQGDPGWPDLTLARPPRLVFAELKAAKGKVRPEQREWLLVLRLIAEPADSAVEAYLWTPDELDAIAGILR